jgi:hypothetical protein
LSIDFSIALLSPSSVDAESWLSLLSIPSRERKTGEYKAVAMYLESRSSQDCASSAALCVRSLTREEFEALPHSFRRPDVEIPPALQFFSNRDGQSSLRAACVRLQAIPAMRRELEQKKTTHLSQYV